jgi:hypothetical protein
MISGGVVTAVGSFVRFCDVQLRVVLQVLAPARIVQLLALRVPLGLAHRLAVQTPLNVPPNLQLHVHVTDSQILGKVAMLGVHD